MENIPEDMQVTFETDKIEVRIKKAEEKRALKEEEISASILLEEMEEGTYEVPVFIVLPEGYELVQDVTAEIEVTKVQMTESNKEQEE